MTSRWPSKGTRLLTSLVVACSLVGATALASCSDDEVAIRSTEDSGDSPRRTSDTTDGSDTTDSPDTTDRRTTTTSERTTTSSSRSTSTSSTSTTSTTSTTVPATTAPPPTEPPPTEPPTVATAEQLEAALLAPPDFIGTWTRLSDTVEIPSCQDSVFPAAPIEAQSVMLNEQTQQSAGNILQVYDTEPDSISAFNDWQQQFECEPTENRAITQLDFGAPLCDDEFYYFVDYLNPDGTISLRSSIIAERCGKNISVAYYDENIAVDVQESTDIVETTLLNALARFITLPS